MIKKIFSRLLPFVYIIIVLAGLSRLGFLVKNTAPAHTEEQQSCAVQISELPSVDEMAQGFSVIMCDMSNIIIDTTSIYDRLIKYDWDDYKSTIEIDFNPIDENLDRDTIFRPLIDRLIQDGFSESDLSRYFQSDKLKYIPDYMAVMTYWKSQSILNDHLDFSSSGRLFSVRPKLLNFYESYKNIILSASERFKIPPQLILAIIWTETRCGYYTGFHSLLNVFANLALFTIPEYRYALLQKAWNLLPEEEYDNFEDKVIRRSEWGYEELKELILIDKSTHYDILELKGSYAGAFGVGQFLPSSYRRYAVDGNNDGKKDLFNLSDACYSVAYFLKAHGYNESMDKAILAYNPDGHYLATIKDVYRILTEALGDEDFEFDEEMLAQFDYYGFTSRYSIDDYELEQRDMNELTTNSSSGYGDWQDNWESLNSYGQDVSEEDVYEVLSILSRPTRRNSSQEEDRSYSSRQYRGYP